MPIPSELSPTPGDSMGPLAWFLHRLGGSKILRICLVHVARAFSLLVTMISSESEGLSVFGKAGFLV